MICSSRLKKKLDYSKPLLELLKGDGTLIVFIQEAEDGQSGTKIGGRPCNTCPFLFLGESTQLEPDRLDPPSPLAKVWIWWQNTAKRQLLSQISLVLSNDIGKLDLNDLQITVLRLLQMATAALRLPQRWSCPHWGQRPPKQPGGSAMAAMDGWDVKWSLLQPPACLKSFAPPQHTSFLRTTRSSHFQMNAGRSGQTPREQKVWQVTESNPYFKNFQEKCKGMPTFATHQKKTKTQGVSLCITRNHKLSSKHRIQQGFHHNDSRFACLPLGPWLSIPSLCGTAPACLRDDGATNQIKSLAASIYRTHRRVWFCWNMLKYMSVASHVLFLGGLLFAPCTAALLHTISIN